METKWKPKENQGNQMETNEKQMEANGNKKKTMKKNRLIKAM